MSQRTIIGVISTALVISMVVLGLTVIGSPTKARNKQTDRLRVDRLTQLHYQLESRATEKGELPESLQELAPEGRPVEQADRFDARRDPETGDLWDYRKLAPLKYEVCATFHEPSERQGAYSSPHTEPGFFVHGRGRQCLTNSVRSRFGQGGSHPSVEPDFIYGD